MCERIYDLGSTATCNVCGDDCWLSSERNFNGARCKNIMCNSHDITYKPYDVVSGDGPINI